MNLMMLNKNIPNKCKKFKEGMKICIKTYKLNMMNYKIMFKNLKVIYN